MNKKHRPIQSRMIHIRLDEATHRRLKVYAAQLGITIQETVASLVHLNIVKSPGRGRKR